MLELEIKEVERSEIKSALLRRVAHARTSISKYFLAIYDRQEVGIAHIGVNRPPGVVFIHYLFVVSENRGMGFGDKLLETVEQFARINGNNALELEPGQIDLSFPVNKVEAWYRKRGYLPTHKDVRKYRKYIQDGGN